MSGRLPCPHEGCPGLEMHDGKPDGCGHPTITEGCRAVVAERDGLRLACQALALVVHEEFDGFEGATSLTEIVTTWTPHGITAEMIEALGQIEGSL